MKKLNYILISCLALSISACDRAADTSVPAASASSSQSSDQEDESVAPYNSNASLSELLQRDFQLHKALIKTAYRCGDRSLDSILDKLKKISSEPFNRDMTSRLYNAREIKIIDKCLADRSNAANSEDREKIAQARKSVPTALIQITTWNNIALAEREKAVRKLLEAPFNCKFEAGKIGSCDFRDDYELSKVQHSRFTNCRPFPRSCASGKVYGSETIDTKIEMLEYFLGEKSKTFISSFQSKIADRLEPYLCSQEKLADQLGIKVSDYRRTFCADMENANSDALVNLKKLNDDTETIGWLKKIGVNTMGENVDAVNVEKIITYDRNIQGVTKIGLDLKVLQGAKDYAQIRSQIKEAAASDVWRAIEKNGAIIDQYFRDIQKKGVQVTVFYIPYSSQIKKALLKTTLSILDQNPTFCRKKVTSVSFSYFGNEDLGLAGRSATNKTFDLTISLPYGLTVPADQDEIAGEEYSRKLESLLPKLTQAFQGAECYQADGRFSGEVFARVPDMADEKKVDLVAERLPGEQGFKLTQAGEKEWRLEFKAKITQRSSSLNYSYILSGSGSLVYPQPSGQCKILRLGQLILQEADTQVAEYFQLKGDCAEEIENMKEGRFTVYHSNAYSGNGGQRLHDFAVMIK